MSTLDLKVPRAFSPLLAPSRYKGAKGGRGSGKSHHFAEALTEECLSVKGTLAVCIREVQKTLAQSAKRLIETKIAEHNLERSGFRAYSDRIGTPGDGVVIFQGMQDHTAESIKSLEGFRIAWAEEAQTLSSRSLMLLRPTIRAPGSELWFSWNPRRKSDAVDDFLVKNKPDNAVVVTANWRDNPWFPDELEAERQLDLAKYPDRYDHIWEGGYVAILEGAYYASVLADARREGRIGFVAADPLLPILAFADIGGAGANADAFVFWLVQFVASEIRVLNYYETRGQVLAHHVSWLRANKYEQVKIRLPHDGLNTNNVTGLRYEDHFRQAGFDVTTIPNQGKGAATQRIEAARRIFNTCRFNEATTEAGRDALGFYHERRDEDRQVGLGPEHDWSSHGADAFGLMALAYEDPSRSKNFNRDIEVDASGIY